MKPTAPRIIRDGKPSPVPYHAAAVERGRAAVWRLHEMGIIDAEGRGIRTDLPPKTWRQERNAISGANVPSKPSPWTDACQISPTARSIKLRDTD